ncbi:MAG: pyridoxal phosphate-dependent aminotransferase, partial [Actinomycetota bacterium]
MSRATECGTAELIDLGMKMPGPDLVSPELALTPGESFADQLTELRPFYVPPAGDSRLRRRLASLENDRTRLSYSRENVVITSGALRGFSLVVDHLVGNMSQPCRFVEVVPSYPLLAGRVRDVIERQGGNIQQDLVQIELRPDFRTIDPAAIEESVEDNTIVYLTNPGNPTGKYLTASTIAKIIEVCSSRRNSYVILDECADVPFEQWGRDRGLSRSPSLIRIQSFSKQYLLAGFRLGYVIAEDALAKSIANEYSFSDGNAPIVANELLRQYLDNGHLLSTVAKASSTHVANAVDLLRAQGVEYV